MKRLTCFAAIGGEISEGPLWWGDSLWWIDVPKGQLHRCPQAGARWVTWDLGMPVGCVAPIAHSSNQVVAALQHGFYQITLGNDGTIKELTQINDPEVHLPDNRFNDGKCDPQGRFWAGTMSMSHRPHAGSLYQLRDDRTTRTALTSVSLSNGLGWSPQGETLYYIDTPTGRIDSFDYSPTTGDLFNRRTIRSIPPQWGVPDGMTVDIENKLWVGFWGGGAVRRIDPENGDVLETIQLPCTNVTSCCFGGENGSMLFITTAKDDGDSCSRTPGAGHVYSYETHTRGLPTHAFKNS